MTIIQLAQWHADKAAEAHVRARKATTHACHAANKDAAKFHQEALALLCTVGALLCTVGEPK